MSYDPSSVGTETEAEERERPFITRGNVSRREALRSVSAHLGQEPGQTKGTKVADLDTDTNDDGNPDRMLIANLLGAKINATRSLEYLPFSCLDLTDGDDEKLLADAIANIDTVLARARIFDRRR